MKNGKRILYITGSFPRLGDGIGDAAGRLYDAIADKKRITLVTSRIQRIEDYISEKDYGNTLLVDNWRIGTVLRLLDYVKKNRIQKVVIEYAGNGYKKDLAISFFPLLLRIHNILKRNQVECHVRLHEFSMCRPARKLFTYPLIRFCDTLDTPSYTEYLVLRSKYGNKVIKSGIGSNFSWLTEKPRKQGKDNERIHLGFFGGIYPGKGIEKLFDIWELLEKKYPDKYDYALIGGFPEGLTHAFDEYQKKIQELIEQKGLGNKLTITGFLDEAEIEKQLDYIDIAVLPYEDGLTLRRGSFLAFLGRQVAIVTSNGDEEAQKLFSDSKGVKLCSSLEDYVENIEKLTEDFAYFECGCDNAKFRNRFEWANIANKVFG